ncbi:hypothetical protein [Aurantibacillus circumpalustris]|uniref:hypothetical protein n=1 Tax=Aurantibacillus circumpalustris TaxID=3036359 RepID=UPI00295B2B67|nr:hypothetical protein [Aurantibacillus circumpalustris]
MEKGYLVTLKGDTLRGEVKINPKKEIDNYNKVTFKDETGLQKIYKPNKTLAYGFNNEKFVSMDSQDDEKKFYKIICTGVISFYKLGFETIRMNAVTFEEEYYVSKEGDKELTVIKESKFKKQLNELMSDNLEFVEAYGDEKKFDFEKALEIITNYNSWKATQ